MSSFYGNLGGGGDNTEVISARTGADGTRYGSLKGRLDAENTKLKDEIAAIVPGLTDDAKAALLDCFEHVAWIDNQGQTYYDALYDALYPTLTSITAVFTQGGATIYDTQSLDDLKQYLVVTVIFTDGTERTLSSYTLSGTLTAGTSTITVTYQGLTTTFTVTVTHNAASLTAVYTQSGTLYTTDSLDSLKSDLVVTYYADAQSAGVVLSDNDYTLSGTLTEGTSTITVTYLNTSATFNVTVTDGSYIEAVFTQPQTTIYTDDSLDSLKSNLVVTYYSAPGATGTVVASSAYTLVGTLTEGTSVITASYQGLTDTFSVTVTASPFIYRLQNTPVEFDGSTGIDTGVQLLSTNRSFTIVLEFVDYRNYTVDQTGNHLFGCYIASSPYTGIFLQEYDGGAEDGGASRLIRHVLRCTPLGTSGGQVVFDSTLPNESLVGRVVRAAFKYDSTTGNVNAMVSVNGTALTPSVSSFSYTYTAINNDLIVGARKGTNGMVNYVLGVYNDFRVYDTVLSDAEMQSYIEGVV